MEESRWRPLSVNGTDAIASYDALHDGIPGWISTPFWEWVVARFYWGDRPVHNFDRGELDSSLLKLIGIFLRFEFKESSNSYSGYLGANRLETELKAVGRPLDIADFLLAHAQFPEEKELEAILSLGSSKWKVGQRAGFPGLELRVPEGVSTAADEIIARPGNAGRRLATAWEKLYGLKSNYSEAYSQAIKAVEDAVLPVVTPNDKVGTLGKALTVLENQKWTISVAKESQKAPPGDVLVGMLRMLWTGESGRHGGGTEGAEATFEEAVMAVSIAVAVVNMFSVEGLAYRVR